MRVGIDVEGVRRLKASVDDDSAVIASAVKQATQVFAGVRQSLGPRAVNVSRTLGDLDAACRDSGRSALFRTVELVEAVELGVQDFLKQDSEAAEELTSLIRAVTDQPDLRR